MESIFAKIPDLGEKIFKELDNQSLVKCKEVQRSWYNFVIEEKVLFFRMIQNYIGDDNEFLTAWRKVLRKAPVDDVSQIAFATQLLPAKYIKNGLSPIHMAANDGNLDLYQQIMLKLAGMNKTDIFGTVDPLFHAAFRGHYNICKHIIENVDEKNPAMPDGVTPLMLAAQNGHYEICKLIISNVDDKNPAMHNGVTPLFMAVLQGHYQICKLIVSNVNDTNPARNDGVTPLFIAAYKGHYEICKLIITNVDDKNPTRNDGITPLYIAAERGHYEIFKLIFESLGDTNKTPRTDEGFAPLHTAAWNGHLKICKVILEDFAISRFKNFWK